MSLTPTMDILYLSQYFPPEMGAPAARVHELAREWVRAGHAVTVLTGFPNHPSGTLVPPYGRRMWRGVWRETVDGIQVIRAALVPLPNRRAWERALNYGSFWASASLVGRFLPRPDVLIATSPQLLVGLAGSMIVRDGTPFVFEVRDLWPESLVSTGNAGAASRLYRMLDRIAERIYARATKVVAVSEAIGRFLVERRGLAAARVAVVENGVDLAVFRPAAPDPAWRERLARGRPVVVSYIGTLGNAAHLWTLLDAAKRLAAEAPEVSIAVVGQGAEREALERRAAREGLANVHFHGEQPRGEVPAIIGATDLCLVLLRKDEVFKTVIPSKMLEFLACGRPVILGVDGQARRILEDAGAGLYVEPQDPDALADAVRRMIARRAEWPALGQRGAGHIRRHFSRQQKAQEYLGILQEAVNGERGALNGER